MLSVLISVGAAVVLINLNTPKSIEAVHNERIEAAKKASQPNFSSDTAVRCVHVDQVITPFYGDKKAAFPPKPVAESKAAPATHDQTTNQVKITKPAQTVDSQPLAPPPYFPTKVAMSKHVAEQLGYDAPKTWDIKMPNLTRGEIIEIRQKIARGEPLMEMKRVSLKSPLQKQIETN